MGYIIGNMSLKTLTILIAALTVGLIYSFFSERKRRPGHPSLILFPILLLAGWSVVGEKFIREYSNNEKLVEVAGIVMMTVCALAILSIIIIAIVVKKKEKK